MIDADKVIARLREKEAEHRRTNRLPYADEYREEWELIERLQAENKEYSRALRISGRLNISMMETLIEIIKKDA